LRRSVFTDRDAAVRADHFQIDVRECGGDTHLLESLVQREHGKGRRERNLSCRGQSGTDGEHVHLRNTALKKSSRKLLGKRGSIGGLGKVRIQGHYVRIHPPHFHQSLSERLARGSPHRQFVFRLG